MQSTNATKLQSLLENMPGKVSQKYWDKLPYNDVIVDQETGRADDMSVKKAIEKFVAEYPEIIQKQGGPNISAASPKSVTEGLADTREDMLKRMVGILK